jgi:glycosyltransferase 2 family protein
VRRARPGWHLVVQVVVIGAALVYLWRTVMRHRDAFANTRIELHALPILVASVLTIATYAYMVFTWTRTMPWWGASLGFREGWRIWALSNLARFIPGGIWQFAGIAALAARAGTSPIAATGGVVLQQLVVLVSGVAVTAAFLPALALRSFPLSYGAAVVIAVFALAVLALLLPRGAALMQRLTTRFFSRAVVFPSMRSASVARYAIALIVPWLAYGVAFWLFARGTIGSRAPGLPLSIASFTAAYVWGIIWIPVPAGLGVREAALVALLSSQIGADAAVILAVGSRIWLTAVEIIGAFIAIGLASLAPLTSHRT